MELMLCIRKQQCFVHVLQIIYRAIQDYAQISFNRFIETFNNFIELRPITRLSDLINLK